MSRSAERRSGAPPAPYDESGANTVAAKPCASALRAVREACPGILISLGNSRRSRPIQTGWTTSRGGPSCPTFSPCQCCHDGQVLSNFAPGNYRLLVATGRPFSSGILADSGFDLVHAVFSRPLPLGDGLDAARKQVESVGRPATALAAFELHIPKPLSPEDFEAFNAPYGMSNAWRPLV